MTAILRAIACGIAFWLAIGQSHAQSTQPIHLTGTCGPAVDDSRLLFLMGYQSLGSIGCDSVDIDWQRRIVFRTAGREDDTIVLDGHGEDHGLAVERITTDDRPERATGRCALQRSDEDDGPRILLCYVAYGDGLKDLRTVRVVIADPVPAPGSTTQRTGRCVPSDVMATVQRIEVERATQAEQPNLPLVPVRCDTLVLTAWSRATFMTGNDQASAVTFAGTPGTQGGRIWLSSIAFGKGPAMPVVSGTCVTFRKENGGLTLSCGAAWRDGGVIKRITTDFDWAAGP